MGKVDCLQNTKKGATVGSMGSSAAEEEIGPESELPTYTTMDRQDQGSEPVVTVL
jgi:hypothetical protein